MEPAKRVIVNTAAQYVKALTNICLSLYSTRLVLDVLNIDDYGIYALVAGVVGVLGYLTNALVVTTQRYLSYYHGVGDLPYVRKVFANSLLLHMGIGLLFALALFALKSFLMSPLKIDPARLQVAMYVYDITVLMLVVTVLSSPFKALLIARENIVYISVVEVFDGVLRLLLAIGLFFVNMDKLIAYAIGMGIILLINFLVYVVFVLIFYEESHFKLTRATLDKQCMAKLTGFAGWTTYGMLSTMCQTQGTAIVLNTFFGTAINAAYDLAMRVNGAARFVSTSVLNAMNPQIMKEEGGGNREKMLQLASKESKFSTALMTIVAIPIMMEMPAILDFWLKTVPDQTVMFCRALLLAFVIDQLTLGLHAANQATGAIRTYSLLMYTPKVLIVPIAWVMLSLGCTTLHVMWLYVGIELMVALLRIPFMTLTAHLDYKVYLRSVFLPLIPLALVSLVVCWCIITLTDIHYRFFITLMVAGLCGAVTFLKVTLTEGEKAYLKSMIKLRFRHGKGA